MFTTSTFDRMDAAKVDLVCPACKGELSATDEELQCSACSRSFPVIAGIPDLRLFADPYIDLVSDREKGKHLASRENDFDFADFVDYYYSITPAVPPHHARQYTRGLLAAPARAEAILAGWEREVNGEEPSLRLLELGCGTAPLLVVAAARYKTVVGIDIAFRWLVIARKRIAEAGLNIPLVCACAEHLPFRSNTFDRIVSESVIEQVKDQSQTLLEAKRVLIPQGYLFLTTPNRYSVGPDPQAGIWAGGYLPRAWLDSYMKRQGAVPPQRSLLSFGTFDRLLKENGFATRKIFLPQIAKKQKAEFGKGMRMLIDAYNLAVRIPVFKQILLRIGPLLQAIARPM